MAVTNRAAWPSRRVGAERFGAGIGAGRVTNIVGPRRGVTVGGDQEMAAGHPAGSYEHPVHPGYRRDYNPKPLFPGQPVLGGRRKPQALEPEAPMKAYVKKR